jgi:hypothetical protein
MVMSCSPVARVVRGMMRPRFEWVAEFTSKSIAWPVCAAAWLLEDGKTPLASYERS